MFLFLQAVYFFLRFLGESDLHISCRQEAMEKLSDIFLIFDQVKVFLWYRCESSVGIIAWRVT